MMILTETLVTNLRLRERRGGPHTARLLCSRADYPNQNRRVYPGAIWRSEIPRVQPLITQGRFVGLADHPGRGEGASLRDVAVKFTSLELRGHDVIGDVEVVATAAGADVVAIAESGIQIGVSTRGSGTTKPLASYRDPDGMVHQNINQVALDYRLMGIDLVLDPSEAQARVLHFEGLQENFLAPAQQDGVIDYILERSEGSPYLVWLLKFLAHAQSIEEVDRAWDGAVERAQVLFEGAAVPTGRAIIGEAETDRMDGELREERGKKFRPLSEKRESGEFKRQGGLL